MTQRPDNALDPADWMAQVLLYVEDAAKVDRTHALAAAYEEGQVCASCPQLKGDPALDWRPCGVFYDRLVPAGGWCTVWSLRLD